MPHIVFLHTAQVHVATFDRLMAEAAPEYSCVHVVRSAWLDQARDTGLTPDLRAAAADFFQDAAEQADAVLCTCSTIGPLADDARAARSRDRANILRIDRPMMQKAVGLDGVILAALCLESTRAATLELIRSAAQQADRPGAVEVLHCAEAWPLFEAGDMQGFGRSIAGSVKAALARLENPSCIVLAQASMAVAEPFLADLGLPVLTSPRLAVAAVLDAARRP